MFPMFLGFHKWGIPKAGQFILENHGKSMKINWMRTGGTTISGNFHLS
jgi:hypothetical protein